MISAELATRVAEAWDTAIADGSVRWAVPFAELHPSIREAMLKVANAVACAAVEDERAEHKASLQGLLACVEDALKGVE